MKIDTINVGFIYGDSEIKEADGVELPGRSARFRIHFAIFTPASQDSVEIRRK